MGHPERKFHLPTTNFQGRAVGFREGKLNNTQPIQPPTYEWNKSLPLVAVSLWFHFDDQSSPVDFFFGGEGAFEAWNLRVWSCQIDVVFSPEKRALFQWSSWVDEVMSENLTDSNISSDGTSPMRNQWRNPTFMPKMYHILTKIVAWRTFKEGKIKGWKFRDQNNHPVWVRLFHQPGCVDY